MQFIRILCLFCISQIAFGAIALPPEPAAPVVAKEHVSFDTSAPLPNLKQAKPPAKATPVYIYKYNASTTQAKARSEISKLHKQNLPAYFCKDKQKYRVIIGPDLSDSHLKKLMSEVHISPEIGKLEKATIESMEKNTC